MIKRVIGYSINVALVLLGGNLLWWSGSEIYLAQESASWPTVTGTIIRSSVSHTSSRHGSYMASVRYSYLVEGVAYEGTRVRFGTAVGSRDSAGEITSRYPPGASVTVYFQYTNPGFSVLQPSPLHWGTYAAAGAGAFFVLCSGVLLLAWKRTGEI